MTGIDERTQSIINDKKDSVALSMYLLEENENIIRCDKNIYIYNGKCYDLAGPDDVEKMFHRFIMKYGITSAWSKRRDVVESVLAYDRLKKVDKMNDYADLICLNNGIFNFKTKELIPHSQDCYFDSHINIDYDPTQTSCPNFVKYLNHTFREQQDTIQNLILLGGYLIDPECKANKMFMMDGAGAAGKSTLIDTYSMFFHDSQITALSLDELASGSFDKEGLITSRVNFAAEQKRGYIDAEEIKKIVSGDLIKVSRKFKLAATFRPKTKIIVACNGLPKFTDTSEGIFRRLIIIKFKNQYRSEKEIARMTNTEERHIYPKDPLLFGKIKEEKSAIFNLFIEGLIQLRESNYEFLDTDDAYESITEFKRDSDTVREFLEENYEVDLEAQTPIQEVYEYYRSWYRNNVQDTGFLKFRVNEMGRRLKEVFSVDSNGRADFKNNETGGYEKLTVYPIKRIELAIDTDPVDDVTALNDENLFNNHND